MHCAMVLYKKAQLHHYCSMALAFWASRVSAASTLRRQGVRGTFLQREATASNNNHRLDAALQAVTAKNGTDGSVQVCNDTSVELYATDYRGCQQMTIGGRTCQRWTANSPHPHTNHPEEKPGRGIGDHNYCRNPERLAGGLWCYTLDPDRRWEHCPLPLQGYQNLEKIHGLEQTIQDMQQRRALEIQELRNQIDSLRNVTPQTPQTETPAPAPAPAPVQPPVQPCPTSFTNLTHPGLAAASDLQPADPPPPLPQHFFREVSNLLTCEHLEEKVAAKCGSVPLYEALPQFEGREPICVKALQTVPELGELFAKYFGPRADCRTRLAMWRFIGFSSAEECLTKTRTQDFAVTCRLTL